MERKRGHIWKLLKPPYRVTEAGRKWATVIEDWLINEVEMEKMKGVSQLFI